MEKQLKYVLRLSVKEVTLRRNGVLGNESASSLIEKFRFPSGTFNQKEQQETVESKAADELPGIHSTEPLRKQMVEKLRPFSSQIPSRKSFLEAYLKDRREKFGSVLTKAADKLPNFQSTAPLINQMAEKLKPISSQIPNLKRYREAYLKDSRERFLPLLKNLSYTTAWTIGYRKAAEAFVQTDVVKRCKQACIDRLDDCLPFFWKELPEEDQIHFYNEKVTNLIEKDRLQICVPVIVEEDSKLDIVPRCDGSSFGQYSSESETNKEESGDVLQKLTNGLKELAFIQMAKDVVANANFQNYIYTVDFPKQKVSDLLCYLLSLITSEEQMIVFKERQGEVLKCFLDLSWQDLFLDDEDVIWTLLLDSYNIALLWKISKSVRNSDFPKIVQDFLMRSPSDFKKRFVDREWRFGSYFREFLSFDIESIKAMFRRLNAADRARLARHFLRLFYLFFTVYRRFNSESEPTEANDIDKETSNKEHGNGAGV